MKYFLESNNKILYRIPYRSTQHKTGRILAPTFTPTARASSHTQHYNVIWVCYWKRYLHCLIKIYHYQCSYNLQICLYTMLTLHCISPCSPLDVETCRGALFNQCILSCVLMALVYIHNTITWIQMWKQCVVFLQQTVTSKYTPSWCTFTTGADNYHTKAKNSNQMPNSCFTMYIFHTDVLTYLPIQHSQAFALSANSQNHNF